VKWRQYTSYPEQTGKISTQFNISKTLAQILINRGISSDNAIQSFLDPKLSNLSDPKDIPNITKAAKRVLLARERKEKVMVYGDYDVDGVTGTTIILELLKFLGIESDYYIPHRYDEGYGMNVAAIEKIKKDGVDLIITVDCGVSNHKEIELANSLGMEVIITDHHNVPKTLPKAHAIVNPKMIKGDHVCRDLSGAGVAFKFVWAILRQGGIKDSGMIVSLLDLVCLGTIADVVPLIDENRILAVQGFQALSSKSRLGLRSLMNVSGINGNISVRNVNFGIAPRINAAGRLEHASYAVELLMSANETHAREAAKKLSSINTKRQSIGNAIHKEVLSKANENKKDNQILVFHGNDWHPGVIGIVASKILDAFFRPTVLIGVCNGRGRGSARSMDGVNIFNVLEKCKDLLADFGGHAFAAGFEIEPDKIPEFLERIKSEASKMINLEELVPNTTIDVELKPEEINMKFAKDLEILSPFGKGNTEPIFMTRGLTLLEHKLVGKGGHLKLKFKGSNVILDVIGFGHGEKAKELNYSSLYDIVYSLRASEWNGYERVELQLVDMKEAK